MLQLKIKIVLLLSLPVGLSVSAKERDYMAQCIAKQLDHSSGRYVALNFSHSLNRLYHSFKPWDVYERKTRGTVYLGKNFFFKIDTMHTSRKEIVSKTLLTATELLFVDYGDTALSSVTHKDFIEQPLENAYYSPVSILEVLAANHPKANKGTVQYAVYSIIISKTYLTVFINKSTSLLDKVTALHSDDLYGDVSDTIYYKSYNSLKQLYYPSLIMVVKTNGKVKDTLTVNSASYCANTPELLRRTETYRWNDEPESKPEVITPEPYNDHIYFLDFKKNQSRTMVVEFKDFLLIAEAPINSLNGERIIQEAHKISHGKPIKYFAFGHFHPDYLGGVRAFIHNGAEVISPQADISYVQYLYNAPHTLAPDSLALQPKPLAIKEINDSMSITDGDYTLKLYVIGKKSAHTADYLIYYFPAEKLVFEDDLAWIKKAGDLQKAGQRQVGLYKSIKDDNLKVETVIQSWPLSETYSVKTIIPFTELEQSALMK